jgi:hypothetical protein
MYYEVSPLQSRGEMYEKRNLFSRKWEGVFLFFLGGAMKGVGRDFINHERHEIHERVGWVGDFI